MKHLKYLKYVLVHKWYVFIECCKLSIPWAGLTHDLSKFRPSEWFPYVEAFYGKSRRRYKEFLPAEKYRTDCFRFSKEGVQRAFDTAWLMHQHRNPHHWQYWILTQDEDKPIIIEMPMRYRKEMLADWRGAGKAQGFGDNTKAWYESHKHDMVLGLFTRQWIEANI